MLSAKKVLAASMDYTDESVAGAGAIKGAPCEIKSITPITGGNTVTFKWLDSNNVEHTSTMDVMDGQDGEDGKGIASVTINAEEHLIITYTDGSTSDAGEIEVQSAVDSVNGQTGEVVLTASDVNALPDDTTLADVSGDSTHRTVTDAEKTAWNAKSDFSGSYNDLTDKPSIPDEISDLDDTAISSPTNGQVMTYDSTAGKWKNADNNPTITVDSALSTTSENPVQNKVLTTEINKKAEYEEISWEDYQSLSYAEKHNGKQYFVTGAPGSAVSASGVSYDNTTSGMTADNVQDALDEIVAGGGQITVDSAMSTTSTNPLQNKVITLEVQDMRASMLNDELKLSAVELAVSQLQTSALNTELRLSTAELAVSQLQTSMLNMDGAVDDIGDEIADIVNVYGAKNLIPYPFWSNNQASPLYGVSYTINADGSITFSGTSTQVIWFGLCGRINYEYPLSLKAGNYIISCAGLPSDVSSYVGIFEEGNTAPLARATYTAPEGLLELETDKDVFVGFRIPADFAIDTTIKPMLRMASIKDDTFVPYAKTSRELTVDKAEQSEVTDIVNVYGSKNLIPTNYLQSDATVNGITFTNNDDGTFKANGTATGVATHGYGSRFVADSNVIRLKKGRYLVSGSFGGTSTTYGVQINHYLADGTTQEMLARSTNGDVEFEITVDDDLVWMFAIIMSGTTVNNLVFKPMIRLASIEDDTYVPYVPTNATLNKEKMSYADNGVLGAKNFNSYPYANTTKTENGITFTDNGDGTVSVNGTATANTSFLCHARTNTDTNNLVLKNGDYILTGCPAGGTLTTYCLGANRTYNGQPYTLGNDYGDGVKIRLNGDDYSATSVDIGIFIQIMSGTTVNNLVFKPMLRLASDSDNTYQPYAMTNKELTDKVIQSVESITLDNTTTDAGSVRLYRYGNLRVLTGHFRPTVAGTSGANSHIADLPSSADYPQFDVAGICGRGAGSSTAESKVGNILALASGSVVFQGKDLNENMFFNITWVVA